MITLTSNYSKSDQGFVNFTVFKFSLTGLPSGSTLDNILYVFGDNTKVTVKTTETEKIYKSEGTFKVKATISYFQKNKKQTISKDFTIKIKKQPLRKFIITRTVRNENDSNYARATKFTLTPDFEFFGDNLSDLKTIQWDLGNGVISNKPILSNFTFDSANIFNIKMLGYTKSNIKFEDEQIVVIKEFVNDSIKFTKIPPPTMAGHINRFPFQIEITSPISEQDHYVDLYAQFSRSSPPLDNPTKYTFLRSEWRFLDTSFNKIDSIKIQKNQYPIKINDYGEEIKKQYIDLPMEDGTYSRLLTEEYKAGNTVGIKGTCRFYFVDDWYNQDQVTKKEQYTTIWATLRSNLIRNNTSDNNIDGLHPGHANSTAQTHIPYVTLWREPDMIKFTRNGCNPIPVMQWAGSDIPFVISLGYKNPVVVDEIVINENKSRLYDSLGGFCRYLPFSEKEQIPVNLVFSNTQTPVSSFLKRKEEPIIQYKDTNDLLIGGYYSNTFEQARSSNVQFSANVTFNEPNLEANNYNPYIWVLNPNSGNINVCQYVYTDNQIVNSPQYFNSELVDTYDDIFIKNKIQVLGSVKTNRNMDTAVSLQIETDKKPRPHISSKFDNKGSLNGLFCIASLNFPSYHAWICDIELDLIYKVTPEGSIIKKIDLSTLGLIKNSTSTQKYNPNSMVLDSNLNLFVTLANTGHVLKFNNEGVLKNVLKLTSSLIKATPICIDTDKENNVYISVINNNNISTLFKYDNNFKYLNSKNYPNINLGNILISRNNKIYVINNGDLDKNLNFVQSESFVEVLNTDLTENSLSLKYKTKKFPLIRNLVLDKLDSLYFSYSYNSIAKLDINGTLFKTTIPVFKKNDTKNKTIIEGLTYSLNNKLYVINSLENIIHVIDVTSLKQEKYFYINPSNIEYDLDSQGQLKYPLNKRESILSKSLKANGDFNGWRWNYKYTYRDTSLQKKLTGTSANILLSNTNSNKFFAKNEDFDMGKTMYGYSFMKVLKESPFLYNNKFYDLELLNDKNSKLNNEINKVSRELQDALNNKTDEEIKEVQEVLRRLQDDRANSDLIYTPAKGFIGSIFGSYPYQPNDLGIDIFSRIANFVDKSSNIDTCDISHLYDIMQKVDFNDNTFKVRFPEGISRIVDYCSISPTKLIGVNCNCGDVFVANQYGYGKCSYCGKEKKSNKGKEIKDSQYKIKAGNFYVLKFEKYKNKYRKISTGLVDEKSEYTITELATSIGLPEAWYVNHSFFEYVPSSEVFALTNYRYLTSYTSSQYNSLTSSVRNVSSEFITSQILSPQVSTIYYTLTSDFYYSTGDKDEWFMYTKNIIHSNLLNFVSSYKEPVYSLSYKTRNYVSSVPFIDYDKYITELDSVKTLNSISNEGINTLTNYMTSVKYKVFYKLDSKYKTENIIDWDNSQTNIPSNLNNSQWYSVNGPVERMINFELQKGLGLI